MTICSYSLLQTSKLLHLGACFFFARFFLVVLVRRSIVHWVDAGKAKESSCGP